MPKIHHFVHLGFDGNTDPGYEKAICDRIESIGDNVKSGINNIIVLVDESAKTVNEIQDESIFRNAGIISDYIITNYICKEKKLGEDLTKKVLYANCPINIIDDLYEFFRGKEKHLYKLLIIIKGLKYRPELKNISKTRKILGYLQEKGIIGNNYKEIKEFEELYMSALKHITRKYSHKKTETSSDRFASNYNGEFKKRINVILEKNIPSENIIQMYMQSEDVPFRVCWKGDKELNPISYMYGAGMGDYSKSYLNRIYMFQTQKRIRNDFERVFREINNRGINPYEVNHSLGGEYYHRCVNNYEGFLRWFGKLEKGRVTKDLNISLVHKEDISML